MNYCEFFLWGEQVGLQLLLSTQKILKEVVCFCYAFKKKNLKDVTMPVYKMRAYHFFCFSFFVVFFSFLFSVFVCKFNFFKLYFLYKKKKKTERFLRIPLYSYLFWALNFVTSAAIKRISTVLTTRTFWSEMHKNCYLYKCWA